jgi:hypothetical protein
MKCCQIAQPCPKGVEDLCRNCLNLLISLRFFRRNDQVKIFERCLAQIAKSHKGCAITFNTFVARLAKLLAFPASFALSFRLPLDNVEIFDIVEACLPVQQMS